MTALRDDFTYPNGALPAPWRGGAAAFDGALGGAGQNVTQRAYQTAVTAHQVVSGRLVEAVDTVVQRSRHLYARAPETGSDLRAYVAEIRSDGCRITRWSDSNNFIVLSGADAIVPPAGARITFEVVGTNPVILRLFVDGALRRVAVDASAERYVTERGVGLGVNNGGDGTSALARWDDWYAHDVGAGLADALFAHFPVAHWPLDGAADDASGNDRTLTVSGATLAAAGRVGQAATFDGVDDYLERAYEAAFNPASDFTVGCWARYDGPIGDATTNRVIGNRPSGVAAGWDIAREGWNAQQWAFSYTRVVDSAAITTRIPGQVVPGRWYFLVATFDENFDTRFYADGVLGGSHVGFNTSGMVQNTTHALRVGMAPNAIIGPMNGRVDEPFFVPRALSQAEIVRLMAVSRPYSRRALRLGAVTHYPLDGGNRDAVVNLAATVTGAAYRPSGEGLGLVHDGVDDRAVLPVDTGLLNAATVDGYTMVVSVRVLEWPAGNRTIFGTATTLADKRPLRVMVDPTAKTIVVMGFYSNADATQPGAFAGSFQSGVITPGREYHVAVTMTGATSAAPVGRLYVDGAFVSSRTYTKPLQKITGDLALDIQDGGTHTLHMDADEPTVFPRALSDDEVAALFRARHSVGQQALAPDAILEVANLTGTVADVDEDPAEPDAAWLVAP